MGRKSTFENYRGKTINGIQILDKLGIIDGRLKVKCKCLPCGKVFEERFHNVYRGGRRSCGCLVGRTMSKSPNWKGVGEIGKSYFNSLIRGAESRNLGFNITMEYIWDLFLKQNKKCAISGIELKFKSYTKKPDGTASLDRIDSSKGYTIDNVQWVHKDVNYMKQSMENQEFLNWISLIYKYNNE